MVCTIYFKIILFFEINFIILIMIILTGTNVRKTEIEFLVPQNIKLHSKLYSIKYFVVDKMKAHLEICMGYFF